MPAKRRQTKTMTDDAPLEAFAAECIQRRNELADLDSGARRAQFVEMLTRHALPSVHLEAMTEVFADLAAASAEVYARSPKAQVTKLLGDIRADILDHALASEDA